MGIRGNFRRASRPVAFATAAAAALAIAPVGVAAAPKQTTKPSKTAPSSVHCVVPPPHLNDPNYVAPASKTFTVRSKGKSYEYTLFASMRIRGDKFEANVTLGQVAVSKTAPKLRLTPISLIADGRVVGRSATPITTTGGLHQPLTKCSIPKAKAPDKISVYATYKGRRVSKVFTFDVATATKLPNSKTPKKVVTKEPVIRVALPPPTVTMTIEPEPDATAPPAPAAPSGNALQTNAAACTPSLKASALVGGQTVSKTLAVRLKGHTYQVRYDYRLQGSEFTGLVTLMDNLDCKGFGPDLTLDGMALRQGSAVIAQAAPAKGSTAKGQGWSQSRCTITANNLVADSFSVEIRHNGHGLKNLTFPLNATGLENVNTMTPVTNSLVQSLPTPS